MDRQLVLTIQRRHVPAGTRWTCTWCGRPWPCPRYRQLPTHGELYGRMFALMTMRLGTALSDLAGRDGPFAPCVLVRRFLWFVPLDSRDIDDLIDVLTTGWHPGPPHAVAHEQAEQPVRRPA
ncbi:hypothetical protein [Micromonospora cathayae]|uniref:Uncharacterized protein n=1 Tax=Micromonospora cathayae TaxID=3028804 RepID=A0ABY7ZHJ8_9ACTN|nr:hypothetical protein [Micromonospora sp. HUAS 3]WDZ82231.1 hypothetical protein PVK37_17145 [Micromonospora sp. HUAS 3]